jgi:hypothetical protein
VFELKSHFVSQKLHRLRVHSVSNVMNIITILTVANFKSGPMTVEQTCENLFIYIYMYLHLDTRNICVTPSGPIMGWGVTY